MSQRQCLPVDDSSDSDHEFDLTKMTALDYLKKVRCERKKIAQVVTVHPMRNGECERLDNAIENENKISTFDQRNPTREWSEIQKEKFLNVQQQIIELRKCPSLDERLNSHLDVDTTDENECIKFCQTSQPLLSTILLLNQKQLEELIECLSSYLADEILKTETELYKKLNDMIWITKWLYAGLACLRLPLDPEVHSCLRVIAKSCIQVTDYLKTFPDTSNDSFLPWNLITVVITLNFKQFDLLSL
ncbi:CLUMA_CG016533, isoform A [Clunio marinus]|uniref:Gem-associated protein 2 n=1 Tax=Clunio marinus TaxID=568069 RepID=A0A1J1IS67_9DIPT|nr:CLUMA_CG016533, isoform A [Clunio marinus]